ncbi:hypothetical protein [Azospirillum formosense]|nr:hypothetical protein [Azospirillum formosense]MBY3756741.1 hypothetical protein [Azospirillum formosense]
MRPILRLLPACIWLWLVRRHAERATISGKFTVHVAGDAAICFREADQ